MQINYYYYYSFPLAMLSVSSGRVSTQLNCGQKGITRQSMCLVPRLWSVGSFFSDCLIADSLRSLKAKEFLKSLITL